MRPISTIFRKRTMSLFGAAALILGCGTEPTNPELALGDVTKRVVCCGSEGGGGGGGTTPPAPAAPVVTYELIPPAPDGDDGWYRSNVSLTWTINYNTADAPTLVGCDEPTIVEDQAETTYSCTATNSVGTTGPVSVSIKRDKTPPKVVATGVVDGGSYVEGSVPTPGCATTDDQSGVKTQAKAFGFSSGGLYGNWHLACHGAEDWAGNTASLDIDYEITQAPPNNSPIASAGGPYTGVEGAAVGLSAAGSSDPDAGDVLSYAWDTDNDGQYDDATGSTPNVTFPDNGSYPIGLKVTDSKGASSTATAAVNVSNAKPTMTFSGHPPVTEGLGFSLSVSALQDAPGDMASLVVTYSCDGGATFSTSEDCLVGDGPSTMSVVARVTDKDGGYTDYPSSVTVKNDTPRLGDLIVSSELVAIGAAVQASADYRDFWGNDGHTASFNWGDGSHSNATVNADAQSFTGSHAYAAAGVYEVRTTLRDDDGGTDGAVHQYVVVYDPTAGFVTGGGWIAYGSAACPNLCTGAAGRGDFGFVSKYKKGATVPEGDARFEFHAGSLTFTSTVYEWLVVAGKRAQFKGRGTINGAGDYGFLVTAVDNTTDAFRIKIWNRTTNEVVFDNQMNGGDDAVTLLNKVTGGGSIVIHAK